MAPFDFAPLALRYAQDERVGGRTNGVGGLTNGLEGDEQGWREDERGWRDDERGWREDEWVGPLFPFVLSVAPRSGAKSKGAISNPKDAVSRSKHAT